MNSLNNRWNSTPLHNTVWQGHLDIVHFFISDKKCDPNIPGGPYSGTPLHFAAEYGHLHIVKYLTDEQHCNPSCLDINKCTPLYFATIKGHIDIVKFLTVEKHCDPMSQDILGNATLHYAVLGGHLEIVKFLIEELKCPADISGSHKRAPIHMAIHMNRSEFTTVTELMNSLKNRWNSTSLQSAAGAGQLNIVRFFISDLNCDPNIPGSQQWWNSTALCS